MKKTRHKRNRRRHKRVINLWNVTDGKTKLILEYINNINLPERLAHKDTQLNNIKAVLLGTGEYTTNELLHLIGYEPGKQPLIINDLESGVVINNMITRLQNAKDT